MSNAIIETRDLHFSYTGAEGASPSVLNGVALSSSRKKILNCQLLIPDSKQGVF